MEENHFQPSSPQPTKLLFKCQVGVNLILKPDKDTTRDAKYRPIFHRDQKILNEILVNQIQQHINRIRCQHLEELIPECKVGLTFETQSM